MRSRSSRPPGEVPAHQVVSDATARAVLRALLDSSLIGVALLRGRTHLHAMVNEKYQNLVGLPSALGLPVTEVLSPDLAPPHLLDEVVASGQAAPVRGVACGAGDGPTALVSFSFLPVREPEADAILVVAHDVTRECQRWSELSGEVRRASDAIGADEVSLFLLDARRRSLRGALLGWDWTRSSFSAKVGSWPNVERALAGGEPVYLTAREAHKAEVGWFESRGIEATLCAPIRESGRSLGVLFFDFQVARPAIDAKEIATASTAARRCARSLMEATA